MELTCVCVIFTWTYCLIVTSVIWNIWRFITLFVMTVILSGTYWFSYCSYVGSRILNVSLMTKWLIKYHRDICSTVRPYKSVVTVKQINTLNIWRTLNIMIRWIK